MLRKQDLELCRVIMPLFNFQSRLKKIGLDSDLWIRKLTREELKSMQSGRVAIIDEFELQLITHALETEIPYEPRKVNETNELFINVVLSLRLFKSGNIHQKVIFFERKKGRGVSAFWYGKTIPYIPLNPYKFARNYVNDFKVLLDKIKSLDLSKHPDLAIPFHYFNKSYDDRLEEKYIDLMIAIESIVRPSGSNIRKQIAVGISMLIGETSKERHTIRANVDEAYGIRNKIVHGEIYRLGKDTEPLFYKVEDYLRRVIVKVLD